MLRTTPGAYIYRDTYYMSSAIRLTENRKTGKQPRPPDIYKYYPTAWLGWTGEQVPPNTYLRTNISSNTTCILAVR